MGKNLNGLEEDILLYDLYMFFENKKQVKNPKSDQEVQKRVIENWKKTLQERILGALSKTEGRKAVDIAFELKLDKATVNRCLYYDLADKCYRDEKYLWYLKGTTRFTKNQKWDIEESVALYDLYFRYDTKQSIPDSAILYLSKILNKRADILGVKKSPTYRNLVGLRMQLGCIQYVVTDGKAGLSQASQLFYDTYKLFLEEREVFDRILKNFYLTYK